MYIYCVRLDNLKNDETEFSFVPLVRLLSVAHIRSIYTCIEVNVGSVKPSIELIRQFHRCERIALLLVDLGFLGTAEINVCLCWIVGYIF